MKKVLITIILSPYILLEVIWTFIFGAGFGAYQFDNMLLDIYEFFGFEAYVKILANYDEYTGRCKRLYGVAKKSHLDKNPKKRLQGRYGNRF